MFEQTFVPQSNRTRNGASLAVSLLTQIAMIAVLILIPLLYTETLPRTTLSAFLTAPAPPPPPPPAPPVETRPIKRAPRIYHDGRMEAPRSIPQHVALIEEPDLPPATSTNVVGSIPGGVPNGVPNSALPSLIGVAPPPPPPVVKDPPKPPQTRQVRVSPGVIQASLIRKVVPPYPPLARQARVQGTVRFTAIIAKDGTIQNLQLISGHPLLVVAATDAIKQWVYKPTLLGTEPVEVITQIEFAFTLSQ